MDIRWTFYFGKACLLAHPETRLTGVSPSGGNQAGHSPERTMEGQRRASSKHPPRPKPKGNGQPTRT